MDAAFWRKCSTCKKEIGFRKEYYQCSVSSCRGKRTGYVFCSVPCWDSHVPGARHKDAAAVTEVSPSKEQHMATAEGAGSQASREPTRRIVRTAAPGGGTQVAKSSITSMDREVLIVASKLKTYIKEKSDMNTSASVMTKLSHIVRAACDSAIESARAEGRKTVLDRDFK